ncbi:MAG TPA: HepT-like ribonuclease domain-containing protein [Thermoanaerobaculia bacterium]|nr:HepT-like ribonuclease domain-containing protein [Thermoanaerobaculia bacterium]
MTPREVEVRLAHIVEAGAKVLRFTAGKSFEEYELDDLATSAVERQLMIIGEAVARIAKSDAVVAKTLGDFPRIIAFRNQLAHNYPNVDDNAVWFIVQREVPVLLDRVRALLESSGDLPA